MGDITRLHEFFERNAAAVPDHLAILTDEISLTYAKMNHLANQYAEQLKTMGVGPGSLVGVLMQRSVDVYVILLAILKSGAAYVPLDPAYPVERIDYIIKDSGLCLLLTDCISQQYSCPALTIHELYQTNFCVAPPSSSRADWCYVIYTSGTTGKPKGVAITHQNVCRYIQSASAVYQLTRQDRVYQGFSIAFDASIEEIWLTFANGATLIPNFDDAKRAGADLLDFMTQHQITCFSSVPTLLAMLEPMIPSLRLLILGGEVCRYELIERWHRDGLRIINTYGPTETTVVATYSECFPNKAITIGKPLDGYEIYLLNESLQPVSLDEEGELCIAGDALAYGYLNQPELNATKFIMHEGLNKRLYRTGDLAKMTITGDIHYVGRMDTQVKLRGFRIELSEIEAVLSGFSGIKNAVVSICEITKGMPLLVAYLIQDSPSSVHIDALKSFLRNKLASHMMPNLYEFLEELPLLPSGKIDRKSLPLPQSTQDDRINIKARTPTEKTIASVWCEIMHRAEVSVNDHFFYDLGGHSLMAAHVISALRKKPGFEQTSVRDLYEHATIEALAKKMDEKPEPQDSKHPKSKPYRVPTMNYLLCGMGQFFGCLLQYGLQVWQLIAVVLCYRWLCPNEALVSVRSLGFMAGCFLSMPLLTMLFCVAFKWTVLGRVQPGEYPLWGWFYFRWWLVDRVIYFICPLKNFEASPLINFYCRLLGAKIGQGCYLGSSTFSIFDGLTIGDDSSIGFDVRMLGYEVQDGWLKIGSISIGNDCYLGSRSVIGMDVIVNSNAVLDDLSMLPSHSVVHQGDFLSGSPAKKTRLPDEYIIKMVKPLVQNNKSRHNLLYGMYHYLAMVVVNLIHYGCFIPAGAFLLWAQHQTQSYTTFIYMSPVSAMMYLSLFYGAVILCKKLLLNQVQLGLSSVHSLYYVRQWMMMKFMDMDEIAVLADSLYLPTLFRFLGAKLGKNVEMGQTPHIIPNLITLADEAFIASSVALAWPRVHRGWMYLAPISMAQRSFSGNVSVLPAGSALGEGVLIGCLTKPSCCHQALTPNSSWLGSPAMFLPKRELFDVFSEEEVYKPTNKVYVVRLCLELIRILLPTTLTIIAFYGVFFVLEQCLLHYSLIQTFLWMPVAEFVITTGLTLSIVCMKWLVQGRLKPTIKPLWDIFIRKVDLVEYAWSCFINNFSMDLFLGTPFAGMLLRCLGAKIGKKVYIGTHGFAEFDLITIEDNVNINVDTLIDTHLFEDRIFKLSSITIKEGCNVGVGSVVLYDTVMEKNATLGDLSLLMKGECLPEGSSWQGIPSQPVDVQPQAVKSATRNETATLIPESLDLEATPS